MADRSDSERRLDRRAFVCGAVASAGILVPGASQAAQQAGAVEFVKGEAFADASAARRTLGLDAPVFIGDRCSTGADSRLTMSLGGKTKVKLGERAGITIDRFLMNAGGEFTLESGPMLFDRPPAGGTAPVQIRSSFGLIAVRGTRFFAGPSKGVFGVFVARGTVTVAGGGREVTLRAGQGTDIPSPGAPPSPPKPWAPPRVRAALASIS
jgi:ferric-dicitrate binding protein FerR (iron transport regulator)